MDGAPTIERADAYPEILGDFLVGGAEVADVAGLIGVGGVIGHVAGIAAVMGDLNRWLGWGRG